MECGYWSHYGCDYLDIYKTVKAGCGGDRSDAYKMKQKYQVWFWRVYGNYSDCDDNWIFNLRDN